MDTLSKTYDACGSLVGVETAGGLMLLPIAHSTANAQIELTVDLHGDLIKELTCIVQKNGRDEQTVIPVTEDSAARSNGNFPHPLCDKLCYVAGDYSRYTKDSKEEYYEKYRTQLCEWTQSEFGNAWLEAIYSYIEKGTLIQDLVRIELLKLDANGLLSEQENKIQQLSQKDVFVRFAVVEQGQKICLWKQREMYDSFKDYYVQTLSKKELCYVSGEYEICTEKHPSKIRTTADKAKLISGNDDSGFTYKGRFSDKNEAVTVGYITSQKAHNALRWLLKRQGYREDGNAIVVWKLPRESSVATQLLPELDVPDIFGNSLQAFHVDMDELEVEQGDEISEEDPEDLNLGQRYAIRLRQAMQGYARDIKPDDKVLMIALDAATPGRLSINFYHEFIGNEFIDRIIEWHENCTWLRRVKSKDAGKSILIKNAPSPKEIALAAFGTQRGNGYLDCDAELRKSTIQRILPCILGLNPKIPRDIIHAAVNRASNPQAYSLIIWENQVMAVACAMIQYNQYKMKKERNHDMEQMQNADIERAELFGRLLAILDSIEIKAIYSVNQGNIDKRPTNAKKLWSVYTRKPKTTFDRLYQKIVQAYMDKLSAGTAVFLEEEIMELLNRLKEIEGFTNKPLKEEYLLGYSMEKQKLKWKAADQSAEGGN